MPASPLPCRHVTRHRAPACRIGRYRWTICALLFFATTINYVDRNSLSVLKTTHRATAELERGRLRLDRVCVHGRVCGVPVDLRPHDRSLRREDEPRRRARDVVADVDRARARADACSASPSSRFLLGAAEAANFPASIKAIAMWFPQKERALATGIFNSGTNVGVMISFAVVWLAEQFGWQWAFITIGAHRLRLAARSGSGASTRRRRARACRRPSSPTSARISRAQEERLRLPWTTLLRYEQIWPFLIAQVADRSGVVVLPVLAAVVPLEGARAQSARQRAAARASSTRARASARSPAGGCRGS